jgi:hypothetical protein
MTMMRAASGTDRPYPSTRGLSREIRVATARSRLRDYLDAVCDELHAAGFHAKISVEPGSFLDAQITVTHTPHRTAVASHLDALVTVQLAWAEDIGWSASHPGIRSGPTPWRFLHVDLAPPPSMVVGFLLGVLNDVDTFGMLYPAQFRYRSQPVQPVIDKLTAATAATAEQADRDTPGRLGEADPLSRRDGGAR